MRDRECAAVGPFVSQKFGFFIADMKQADLNTLAQMAAAGKLTSVIDRRYPLSAAAEAIRYVEAGHARGKVIIAVD